MIERIYMACAAKDEKAEQSGPYQTAEDAESAARGLGWGWVLIYTHTVDESGTVTDIQKRFYQPMAFKNGAVAAVLGRVKSYPPFENGRQRSPREVEALRRKLSTPDVKPLSDEETDFFAEYEKQMKESVNGKS